MKLIKAGLFLYLGFFLFFWSKTILADRFKSLRGIVTVLEAPMFRTPDINSPVIKYVRKGEKIYIHSFNYRNGPQDQDLEMDAEIYRLMQDDDHLREKENPLRMQNDFFVTLDDLGQTMYIPKKYVKIVYEDTRELNKLLSDQKTDETDYRIEDPLPKGYPLGKFRGYKTFVLLGYGNQSEASYPYSRNSIETSIGPRAEFYYVFAKSAFLKEEDKRIDNKRFYYGGMFKYGQKQNARQLVDLTSVDELKRVVSGGPYLSYDAFQKETVQINFFGGVLVNYTTVQIEQNARIQDPGLSLQLGETRNFRSLNFSAYIGSMLELSKVIASLDFLFGASLEIMFPHQITPNNDPGGLFFWNSGDKDVIEGIWDFQGTLLTGIQKTF